MRPSLLCERLTRLNPVETRLVVGQEKGSLRHVNRVGEGIGPGLMSLLCGAAPKLLNKFSECSS